MRNEYMNPRPTRLKPFSFVETACFVVPDPLFPDPLFYLPEFYLPEFPDRRESLP